MECKWGDRRASRSQLADWVVTGHEREVGRSPSRVSVFHIQFSAKILFNLLLEFGIFQLFACLDVWCLSLYSYVCSLTTMRYIVRRLAWVQPRYSCIGSKEHPNSKHNHCLTVVFVLFLFKITIQWQGKGSYKAVQLFDKVQGNVSNCQ